MQTKPTKPWSRPDLPPPDDRQPSRYGTEPKLSPNPDPNPDPTNPNGSPGGLEQ